MPKLPGCAKEEAYEAALLDSVASTMRDAVARIWQELSFETGVERMTWIHAHRLLDDEEAAQLLGVTTGVLRELRALRGLPHLILSPRHRRYERAALMAWIEANLQRGEAVQ